MSDKDVTPEIVQTPTPPATPQEKDGGEKSKPDILFTQADVDRFVGDRAKRAKESAVSGLLDTLGLDSVDSLKSVIEDANKRKEAEMSETEKLQTQLDAMRQSIVEKDAQLLQEKQTRLSEKSDNGLLQLLGKAHNANNALVLIKATKADEVAELVDAAGNFDTEKATALVTSYATDNSELFTSTSPGSLSNHGGRAPAPTNEKKLMEAEQAYMTRRRS